MPVLVPTHWMHAGASTTPPPFPWQAVNQGFIDASKEGSLKVVQALLAVGADKDAKDEVGGVIGGRMFGRAIGVEGLVSIHGVVTLRDGEAHYADDDVALYMIVS